MGGVMRDTWTIGIDIGGTFTDVALIGNSGAVHMNKAPTTPSDPANGVMDALRRAARSLEVPLSELLGDTQRITHGSTIATNALLTRVGAKVGLITTRGFEDTPYIMRAIGRVDGLSEDEIRHVMYLTKPAPLVERSLIRGVPERMDVEGTAVIPLQIDAMKAAVDDLIERENVEALAVCLLNAWVNPVHEQQILDYIESRYGSRIYSSYSHQLARVAGEYARMNTVLADCFVGPKVRQYLLHLKHQLRESGFGGIFLLMQGNGGLASPEQCTPVATLQSGPAGGMLAASQMAQLLGHQQVLTADMGGTSFDVGLYSKGYWRYASEPVFDRFRILQPIIEIESIGAGGGTIAHADPELGRLIVGPQSAGADPGPACYGQGGTMPTVTDANVALGILDPDYFLGGAHPLHPEKAASALGAVAKELGLGDLEVAAGIHQIINGKMADLIRRQVIRSGYLPAEFVLYAFGGAAAIHAVGFARDLGIQTIVVFPTSPVFSAFGIAMADVVHTKMMTCHYSLPTDPEVVNRTLKELESELLEVMSQENFSTSQVTLRRYLTLRFRRQMIGVELEIPWARFGENEMDEIQKMFADRYQTLYGEGAGNTDAGTELGAIRVDAIGPVPKASLRPQSASSDKPPAIKGERRIYLSGSWHEAQVYDWEEIQPGQTLKPVSIVESPFTTVLIPPGATGEFDPYGNLILKISE